MLEFSRDEAFGEELGFVSALTFSIDDWVMVEIYWKVPFSIFVHEGHCLHKDICFEF